MKKTPMEALREERLRRESLDETSADQLHNNMMWSEEDLEARDRKTPETEEVPEEPQEAPEE